MAIQISREKRAELIVQVTEALLTRMDIAGKVANARVLTNPLQSRSSTPSAERPT